LRIEKAWTQEQVAESSRLTRASIVAVEGGKQNVSMAVIIPLRMRRPGRDLRARVIYLAPASDRRCLSPFDEAQDRQADGFATILGGAVAGASETVLSILDEFGQGLGVALQMFDDLGNLIGKCLLNVTKNSNVLTIVGLACAATNSPSKEYDRFRMAIGKLPDTHELESWIEKHNLLDRCKTLSGQRSKSFSGPAGPARYHRDGTDSKLPV
jgi:hypothetical protein